MTISNRPGETHTAGRTLTSAGGNLAGLARQADPGAGAGGDAAPRTDAALGSLGRDWSSGLATIGAQTAALGTFAELVAVAFDTIDRR